MPLIASPFSSSYEEARKRFIDAARQAGAQISSFPIEVDATAEELCIDVALLGPSAGPTLVVSSGVHGVEGFLGSAIQLAWLKHMDSRVSATIRLVFIHAVNPFGFSRIRRFNEQNVDLNRNFLADESQFSGTSSGYERLHRFLNPSTPPSMFDFFRVRAVWNIARYGLGPLKQSIAEGQYDYPQGVFYGGSGPSQAFRVIKENSAKWIGSSQPVLHVDFHSGLGAYADYKLLLAERAGSEQCAWYERVFGKNCVEPTRENAGTAYRASGPMGAWLQAHFSEQEYRFVTAEFGTYGPVRVLASIRGENRAHHYAPQDSPVLRKAQQELLECFCPADQDWRRKVVSSGMDILSQAARGICPTVQL